jgi:hypothetical protein
MGANIAGIYGAQIFRQDDRPRYRRAFSVNCAVLAFGLVLAIVRYIDDLRTRRRSKERRFSVIGAPPGYTKARDEKSSPEEKVLAPPPSADQPSPVLLEGDLRPTVSNGLRGTS